MAVVVDPLDRTAPSNPGPFKTQQPARKGLDRMKRNDLRVNDFYWERGVEKIINEKRESPS